MRQGISAPSAVLLETKPMPTLKHQKETRKIYAPPPKEAQDAGGLPDSSIAILVLPGTSAVLKSRDGQQLRRCVSIHLSYSPQSVLERASQARRNGSCRQSYIKPCEDSPGGPSKEPTNTLVAPSLSYTFFQIH